MKAIPRSVTFIDGQKPKDATLAAIRRSKGAHVRYYSELVEKVAELSFLNPEYLLFFRGQSTDYQIDGLTTIHTPIFRPSSPGNKLGLGEIEKRFHELERAEEALFQSYDLPGRERVRRFSILRWALLQHYEVCKTPLLDITHSLRVACSFASQGKQRESYLYVIGLPQVSGSITTSSEHEAQVIRLLSICPPSALRPHYQEGYLVGEFPTISYRQKLLLEYDELDLANRLVCKFRLGNWDSFWQEGFSKIPREALFPDDRDPMKKKMDKMGL